MISDAKKMFPWYGDKTMFFLPQDFFSLEHEFFPYCKKKSLVQST